jgi:hypothetical protein
MVDDTEDCSMYDNGYMAPQPIIDQVGYHEKYSCRKDSGGQRCM